MGNGIIGKYLCRWGDCIFNAWNVLFFFCTAGDIFNNGKKKRYFVKKTNNKLYYVLALFLILRLMDFLWYRYNWQMTIALELQGIIFFVYIYILINLLPRLLSIIVIIIGFEYAASFLRCSCFFKLVLLLINLIWCVTRIVLASIRLNWLWLTRF